MAKRHMNFTPQQCLGLPAMVPPGKSSQFKQHRLMIRGPRVEVDC